MNSYQQPGLGELLRHVTGLVDRGAEQIYRRHGLDYRPRYTPLMRALSQRKATIGELSARAHLSQGAISQTVNLMERDGLLTRSTGQDARQTSVSLTAHGFDLLAQLEPRWHITLRTIATLEAEIGVPLRAVLADVAAALEKKSFAQRLSETEAAHDVAIDAD